MHSLYDFRVRSHLGKAETQMMKGLGKIVWSVCEILIFSKLTILLAIHSPGHFRLKTLYCHGIPKSLSVKPNFRLLDYILFKLVVRETS